MLRFRLGRIPVEVHFSHFAIAGFLAWSYLPGSRDLGDPRTAVLLVAGMAVVFVSLLVHELGHALVSLAFGYQPTVQLAWFGGLTRPNATTPIPWGRDLLLTAAGPLFGFLLAIAAGFALHHFGAGLSTPILYALALASLVNLWWSLFNLAPVGPLDGGRISQIVFTRLFGRVGFLISQGLGVAVGLGLAYWAIRALGVDDGMWLALFLGLFAAQSAGALFQAIRRPPAEEQGPAGQALLRAAQAFEGGDLSTARTLAVQLTEQEPPLLPAIRARAHYLLGWIAIKEGQGRRALDHFAQAQGTAVEPHALAAAFSLIGDDLRALPLWELAAKNTRDRTLLHEWAGTLLRLGRERDAERISGVDLATAWGCAERVLFVRERYSEAAEAAEHRLALRPTAEAAYDAACARARAGDREGAVALLERASALGFRDLAHASQDPDLASLHGHPGFERWRGRDQSAAP